MNDLSILLVEDDKQDCEAFENYIDTLENVTLVGATGNADKAVQMIKDFLPSALILDLELHNGKGSGFDVMNAIKNAELTVIPYILVTTNNTSALTYEFARKSGADFIFSKHQDGYCAKSVVDFLSMMSSVIHNKRNNNDLQQITTESPNQLKKHLKNRITSELNLVGISPKAVGYCYLTEAILTIIENLDENNENTFTQNISTIIGDKYKKSESSVERAMQNAINRAWKLTDINDLLLNYTAKISSSKGVPTITEFIYYYARKIRNEY